jgi:hypothetical protein
MQSAIIDDPLTRAFIRIQSGAYPLAAEAQYRFTAYDSTTDATVFPNGFPRDNGTPAAATELFTRCGLNLVPPGDFVFLFVDNSGSLTLPAVRATLDLLQSQCDAAGIRISSVFNTVENYVQPFINFTGQSGVPR